MHELILVYVKYINFFKSVFREVNEYVQTILNRRIFSLLLNPRRWFGKAICLFPNRVVWCMNDAAANVYPLVNRRVS